MEAQWIQEHLVVVSQLPGFSQSTIDKHRFDTAHMDGWVMQFANLFGPIHASTPALMGADF